MLRISSKEAERAAARVELKIPDSDFGSSRHVMKRQRRVYGLHGGRSLGAVR
jgi:hypothetical protein